MQTRRKAGSTVGSQARRLADRQFYSTFEFITAAWLCPKSSAANEEKWGDENVQQGAALGQRLQKLDGNFKGFS